MTFSNLFSFDAPQTISFVAGKTAKHPEHVVKYPKRYDPNLVKSAIVYGANASGKSNIIKCFDFIRTFIVKGTQIDESIPRVPFRLRKNASSESSFFEIVVRIKGKIYSYSIKFDNRSILEEKLIHIRATTEKTLFLRIGHENSTKVEVFGSFDNIEEKKFFDYIARGTRPNQPFLTETVTRNSKRYKDIYDWFKDSLVIIYPNAIYANFGMYALPNQKMKEIYAEFFKNLDLGINGISEIEIDSSGIGEGFPQNLIQEIMKEATKNVQKNIVAPSGKRYRLIKDSEGKLHLFKLMTAHRLPDQSETILFELTEESDGTMRLIDLIPALVDLCENEKFYVIDELDRSMHAHLTRAFLEYFFSCSKTESQILATTHELDILDLDLLRKDEIWFVEKDKQAASHTYSLEEFKPRYDKDIRKGYLKGRFGAIPIVRNIREQTWQN